MNVVFPGRGVFAAAVAVVFVVVAAAAVGLQDATAPTPEVILRFKRQEGKKGNQK